jgi:hypothetical protein
MLNRSRFRVLVLVLLGLGLLMLVLAVAAVSSPFRSDLRTFPLGVLVGAGVLAVVSTLLLVAHGVPAPEEDGPG